MLKLTRLLILVSVAILATQPVMACCLTGHGEPAITEAASEAPPCHGEVPAQHQTSNTGDHDQPTPADCPGCFDCDSAIMQAQTFDTNILLTQSSNQAPLAIIAARFDGFEYKPVVLKTGPPGDPPPTHYTPITLKQRLLI